MIRLPSSLERSIQDFEREHQDDWQKGPCGECGAVPVVRERYAGLAHKKTGCRTPADRSVSRWRELAERRIRSRWS
jgi:hypothetical protein